MLGKDNSKFENYVVKHDKKKKWIAIALCVALLTGTGTMYMMNKPATAVTEEGAEDVGMVLNSGSEESVEEEPLTEKIAETEPSEESGEEDSADNSESSDAASGSESSESEDIAEKSDEETSENGASEESENEENTETSDSADTTDSSAAKSASTESSSDETLDENADEATDANSASKEADASIEDSADENKTAGKNTEAPLNIPDSVDLADYVTETIIERLNEDGEWVVISEDDILPGDKLRVTFNYTMPNEAAASDDIQLNIPENLGVAESATADLQDGNGTYEVTDDNKLKIQYSDEYKEEVTGEAPKISTTSSFAFPYSVNYFFRSIVSSLVIVAHAEETEQAESDGNQETSTTSGSATAYLTVEDSVATVSDKEKRYTIKSVTAKKWDRSGSIWVDIADGATVDQEDKLKFKLNFTIPKGTLGTATEGDRQIVYNLGKNGIKILESITDEPVYIYGTDKQVGKYSITKEGVATITYDKLYAAQNYKDSIDGYLEFTSSVHSIHKEDGDEHQYKFFDNVTFDIKIGSEEGADISIEKSNDTSEISNGILTYTIKVKSDNGTNGNKVYLSDVMSVYEGSQKNPTKEKIDYENKIDYSKIQIKVEGAAKEFESLTVKGNTFEAVLPAMEKNSKYIIKYAMPVPDEIRNNDTLLLNKATAYFDKDDEKSAESNFHFDPVPLIKKVGSADKTKRTIEWKITLNQSNANLNGYTLTDIFLDSTGKIDNGTPYIGKATVSPAIDGKTEIDIPYSFNKDDYNKYTITINREYSLSDASSSGQIVNYAVIRKDKSFHEAKAGVVVGGNGAALEKKAVSVTPDDSSNSEHKLVNATWNVTVKAPIYKNEGNDNAEYWTYYDVLQSPGFITQNQLDEIQNNLRKIFDENCVVKGDDSSKKTISGTGISGYKKFTIKFFKDLTDSNELTFSYTTKADVGNGLTDTEIKNSAWIYNEKFKSNATQKYQTIIEKYDGLTNSKETSSHDYTDSSLFSQGILTWKFRVAVPDNFDSDITITEALPEGTSLVKDDFTFSKKTFHGLEVSMQNDFGNSEYYEFEGNTGTVKADSRASKAIVSDDGRTITITVDKDTVKEFYGQSIYFRIKAKISDDYKWPEDSSKEYKPFKNTVSVKWKDGEESASQTQNITKTDRFIFKTGKLGGNMTAKYEIDVNPGKEDLLQDSATLVIDDILTSKRYEKNGQVGFDVTMIPGSFKVYEVDDEGDITYTKNDDTQIKVRELSASEYSYSIISTNQYEYESYDDEEYLTITVPDGKHLLVVYSYIFNGAPVAKQAVVISNKATLKGIVEGGESTSEALNLLIEDSKSETGIRGITLYKVDSDNMGKFLNGAEFKLYRYNPDTGAFDIEERTVTTATNALTGIAGEANVSVNYYNTAYMLVETKAPEGYSISGEPYYFLVKNTSITDENLGEGPMYSNALKPGDFYGIGGVELTPSHDVYIKNTASKTRITLNKIWDDDGASSYRPSSIKVKLDRKLGNNATGQKTKRWSLVFKLYNGGDQFVANTVRNGVVDGSDVSFSLTQGVYWNDYTPSVTVNGSELPGEVVKKIYENDGKEKYHIWNYSFKAASDAEIIIKLGSSAKTGWNNAFNYPEVFTDSTKQSTDATAYWSENNLKIVEPETITADKPKAESSEDFPTDITITEHDGWSWTSENLDRYYYPKDSKGNYIYENGYIVKYEWLYYFTEYTSMYYDATFSSNNADGINFGTIELVNKRNKVQGYSMPATGSTGTAPFTYGGLGVLGAALIGSAAYNRRRRRRAS